MIYISATFTAEPLKVFLDYFNNRLNFNREIIFAPYNQVFQQILDPSSHFRSNMNGINIILLRLDDFVSKKKSGYDFDELAEITEHFLEAINSILADLKVPLIIYLCPPSLFIIQDSKYFDIEKKFIQKLQSINQIYFFSYIDSEQLYPVSEVCDPHTEEIAHIPYTEEYFCSLGTYIARKLHALTEIPYKVIILDCDYCGFSSN